MQHFCKVPIVGSSPTMTSIFMKHRRSFFKSLIGLIVAPKVAEALPAASPHQMIGYKCSDFVPVIYAPYMLLFTMQHKVDFDAMLLTNMSKAIQEEIDNDMVKN